MVRLLRFVLCTVYIWVGFGLMATLQAQPSENLYDSVLVAHHTARLDSLLDALMADDPDYILARLTARLDSLIAATAPRPFNGLILVSQGGRTLYARTHGHADMLRKTAWPSHPQFVIGSVSKQVTAVLVLRACDRGRVQLHTPIRAYLPALPQPWADTVTLHQLLNHTSGFVAKDQPLAFRPGSRFSYSNSAYNLLGEVLAAVEGKPYEDQVRALFRKCGMRHSTTPRDLRGQSLVPGFARQADGSLQEDTSSLKGWVPAALLISQPADIARWNKCLHERQNLLSPEMYRTMTTPSATRDHPIFGNVDYGYGLQFTHLDGIDEISHGGYVPGFVAVNFYYPNSKISLVVMENLDWKDPSFHQSFSVEMEARKLLRASGLLDQHAANGKIGK